MIEGIEEVINKMGEKKKESLEKMIEIHVKGLNDSNKDLLKICSIFDRQPYFDFL